MRALESPPVSVTVNVTVPAEARSVLETEAVTDVDEANVVAWGALLILTTEPEVNPDPVRVIVNVLAPAVTLVVERLERTGGQAVVSKVLSELLPVPVVFVAYAR